MVENKKGFQIAVHCIMIFLVLICTVPFLLMVISSFTEEKTLIRNGYSFFPQKVDFTAYRYLLLDSGMIVSGYLISAFVTVFGTAASLVLTMLLAYPLSRRELPGRNIFAFLIFFTMLFQGGLVPSYMMWTGMFHIKNTIWALIVPNLLVNAFYIIMVRTFLTTNIPDAIVEAGRIDGASELVILVKLVLPMSKPIIATVALLVALAYWNNWLNGMYYISEDRLNSIQVILNKMLQNVQFIQSGMGGDDTNELIRSIPSTGIRMAVAVMGTWPIMVVYPFFQKYFVQGITIGAVKG